MKIYYHPYSTYARRVRIALIEKRLDIELVPLDMAARRHREPEYLALNPYGRVPTLVDGDFVLYESTAILTYLEALHPEPALLPADPRERARVEMHMKLCDLQFSRQCGTIVFPKRFLPKERWDERAFEQARIEIGKHLAILDRELAGKEYVAGGCYSLVEVCYTPWLGLFDLMGIAPPPNVASWSERLLARQSARETVPEV